VTDKSLADKPTSMQQVIRSIKGGQGRAAALTPERRREIAKKAASARWKKL
jgi:hypothetical protein